MVVGEDGVDGSGMCAVDDDARAVGGDGAAAVILGEDGVDGSRASVVGTSEPVAFLSAVAAFSIFFLAVSFMLLRR